MGLDVGVYFGDRKEFGLQTYYLYMAKFEHSTKEYKEPAAPISIGEFLEDVVCIMVDEVHGKG